MGKGRSAPPPPDPYKTAEAQTGTNVATAVANQHLANVNQETPYGSLNYNQTGTYQFTDPNSGKTYDLPTYTATQSLSQHGQDLMGLNNQTELNMARLGQNQSNSIMGQLSTPLNTSVLPPRSDPSSMTMQNYQTAQGGPDLMTGLRGVGGPQRSISGPGRLANNIDDAGQLQRGIQGQGSVSGQLGDAGRVSGTYGDAGDITRSYGTDFSQDRGRVEEALMSRLNPSLERDRSSLEARLASQGIGIGSEAYDNAMGNFNRKSTDARMQAILAGGQEQSRLAGLEANRAAFENQAQRQGFDQLDRRNAVANAAQGQRFGQGLQAAQFANQAQQQRYNQATGLASLNNTAQGQQFAQNQAQAQFGNQAQNQRFGQNLAAAEFGNQAQAQQFGQQQAMGSADQQQYQNQLSALGINNALQDQRFNSEMARNNAMDAARNQALQEELTMRNQPINEITALMSGAQVQTPQFVNSQSAQIPTTDIAGLIQNNYQQQVDQANQRQNSRDSMWGTLGGLGKAYIGAG